MRRTIESTIPLECGHQQLFDYVDSPLLNQVKPEQDYLML